MDHRILAADLVGGHGDVEGVAHLSDDVEVRQRGLDHDHIGAFLDVERHLAQGFAGVGRVHLVAAPVAELRRRVGSVTEGPVETRSVLGGVAENGRVLETVDVERLADGPDAPVHHVRGRDHVGARARVAERSLG